MIINNPQEMVEFGKKIAGDYKIVFLEGDLGAGKTLFTKGFASKLGMDENIVLSPTYTYINIYGDKILHLDMYRLSSFDELVEKGLLDQLNSFEYIVVEWPKFIDQLGLKNYIRIKIDKLEGDQRNVEIIS